MIPCSRLRRNSHSATCRVCWRIGYPWTRSAPRWSRCTWHRPRGGLRLGSWTCVQLPRNCLAAVNRVCNQNDECTLPAAVMSGVRLSSQTVTDLLLWLSDAEPVDVQYVQVRFLCQHCHVRQACPCVIFDRPVRQSHYQHTTIAAQTAPCTMQAVLAEHAAAADRRSMAAPLACRDLAIGMLLRQVSDGCERRQHVLHTCALATACSVSCYPRTCNLAAAANRGTAAPLRKVHGCAQGLRCQHQLAQLVSLQTAAVDVSAAERIATAADLDRKLGAQLAADVYGHRDMRAAQANVLATAGFRRSGRARRERGRRRSVEL